MKTRIIWKFWAAYILLILIPVLVLNFFIRSNFQSYYHRRISSELASNARLAGELLKDDLSAGREGLIQTKTENISNKLGVRVTVIDSTGKVLGDSDENPSSMENHIGRKEVTEAIESGVGEASRKSITLGLNMKYLAVSFMGEGGAIGVVRLSMPLTEIERGVDAVNKIFIMGGLLAIIITLIVGYFVSKNISRPIHKMKETALSIAGGDLTKRASVNTTDELGDLARALNQMADELELKVDNLEKLDRVRTDFVANVSHELKTPLTSIKGFIETLEDGAIDEKENAKKFLSIIRKHTERLDNIINDLLNLTEMETGKERIDLTNFDLKALLDEVTWSFTHALSIKKQNLKVDYKGKNFNIKGDKDKIEQVLVNLIDNALKYTRQSGEIKVSLFEEKDNVMFVIEDNGIGISKEHLDRIFERFYRVDKARSREAGGTGLGLAIVKHAISLHNGHIEIDSELGKGTKITVILPK